MIDWDWTPREKRWAVFSAVLAAVLIGSWLMDWLAEEEPAEAELPAYVPPAAGKNQENASEEEKPKEKEIVVDIKGAVKRPGVYRMDPGTRVWDAVRRAGGASDRADLDRVNLAEPLSDGMAIYIPRRGELPDSFPASASPAGTETSGNVQATGGKVNINTATAEELEQLEGIGPSKAKAIVRYREEHGRFRSIDEVANVPGIGEKTLDKFRHRITL